jgi:energy-coupling factor transport system permease protein
VAVGYLGAACAVGVFYDHPVVLGAALAGIVFAGIAAGVGRQLGRAARFAAPLVLLIALVNPLVTREGLTLLARGPVVPVIGRLDVTLEALVYGAVAGLRVLLVVLAFALYSAAVDPDRMLRAFRRFGLRSSLTASLTTRLVPVLGRDAERLSAAYGLRASSPARAVGAGGGIRRAAVLNKALAAGALERAIEVAAALEVRGFAAASRLRVRPERAPWSRHDVAFGASALALGGLIGLGLVTGIAEFSPYPAIDLDLGIADCGFALAIPAVMLLPFLERRADR